MIICIPCLRRYDLLRNLLVSLASSDVQPDAVYILDNGRNTEKIDAAVDGFDFPIIVQTPEVPLGVAASWNWFIKNVPSDEWLITNDDMTFAPQTIARMRETPGDIVFGFGFSCYLLRRSCVEKVGLFDETISPGYAYFEDCDYIERIHAQGDVSRPDADSTGLIHGDGTDGSSTYRAGTKEEIAEHWRKYHVAQTNFVAKWGAEPQVLDAQRVRSAELKSGQRPRLLWVGDAACPSGFARATHEILDTLRQTYDVTVLGLNYNGDKHVYPYDIYTCFPGGDAFGVGRLVWMCDRVQPDVIVLQNDGWNIPYYISELVKSKRHAKIPAVAAVAVDGKNFDGWWLKGIAHAIFWTQFALDQARRGGYVGSATVIPLGVDTKAYCPGDKREARKSQKLDKIIDAFIVGNVNRNQPRKRWDLTLKYFAKWVKGLGADVPDEQISAAPLVVQDAWLYLHTAPTGDVGVDVVGLAKYYGINMRLALMEPEVFYGISEKSMRDTYASFDVQISTTQGEGFGLTTFEGMACGVPQIVPDWSALGELTKDAALLVPCSSTCIGSPYKNVIGGVADEAQFIKQLDRVYRSRDLREYHSEKGLALAHEERFRWPVIGARYVETLDGVLGVRAGREAEAGTLVAVGGGA